MKYLCTGANRETGARMTLEFEAHSRADAERKATQSGMEVLHTHEVHDQGELPVERHTHRGEDMDSGGGKGKWLALAVVLVVAGVLVIMLWPRIAAMLRR
jgi:hypothetical protein